MDYLSQICITLPVTTLCQVRHQPHMTHDPTSSLLSHTQMYFTSTQVLALPLELVKTSKEKCPVNYDTMTLHKQQKAAENVICGLSHFVRFKVVPVWFWKSEEPKKSFSLVDFVSCSFKVSTVCVDELKVLFDQALSVGCFLSDWQG